MGEGYRERIIFFLFYLIAYEFSKLIFSIIWTSPTELLLTFIKNDGLKHVASIIYYTRSGEASDNIEYIVTIININI